MLYLICVNGLVPIDKLFFWVVTLLTLGHNGDLYSFLLWINEYTSIDKL